jgi:predicted RNA-binding Zn-ribbon protein involved in translation (DUF1610 family)
MKVVCGSCGTHLKANDELAGKTAKCPKCGNPIEIQVDRPRGERVRISPATDRQKDYAVSLGIEFSPDVNRKDISKLIDAVVQKEDDERFDRLEELSRRENKAWQEMREEVLAEIDEEDCRLSVASPKQMVNEFSNRNRGAILISFDRDEVSDFGQLANVNFEISFSDDIAESEMRSVLMSLGYQLFKQSSN